MAELFDTHFHLYPEEDDAAAILKAARAAGVATLTAIATDLESSLRLAETAASLADPALGIAVGVHPHEAAKFDRGQLPRFRELTARPPVWAVGEIGLDYHYDFSPRPEQHLVFATFLELALAVGLPVVVHCREAEEDCLKVLRDSGVAGRLRILFHSFTGEADWARRFLDEFDAWFSFNGIATFKQADNVRAALAAVPDRRLLLETDSPYLAPPPFRGKRNSPAHLPHIAEFIAAQRGLSRDRLAALTTVNARAFFGLAQESH